MLELVEPTKFTAKLDEPAVAVDPTTGQKTEQLPSYNAYSIDGDVTAPLVYVNYGRVEDYEQLDRLGISVRGAIVIVRYGQNFRGIKPKIAFEHGAVGCLIYSDPKDDGFAVGAVFPNGPMRPSDGVQRGSVEDLATASGDPLTIGVGAVPGARRTPINESPILTKIPVLPISYGDAQPLLAALAGPMAPEAWRGALPIPYRIGAGPAKVHLKVAFNWDTKPLYDVIAKIPGSTFPDEWIIRGNHHDAWVNGANDPVSGMSPELEEARALGELRKQGWAPKRTIVYAAWDGEEPGLLGSTEWVEAHEADLKEHAVAYINTDGNGRGFLSASGSHSLERFVNGVARDINDPETGVSIWKRRQAAVVSKGTADERKDARERADLRIGALGSGSDYTPFVQHAGVASINLSFGDEDEDGIYHSIYDDFYFYTHFLDTDFAYGRALAQTVGTAVIRLADADVVPIEFTGSRRHGAEVRPRAEGSAEQEAGRHPRAQPPDRRRRVRGDARSEEARADAEGRGRSAGDQLRAARQRRRRRWPTARAGTTRRSPQRRARLAANQAALVALNAKLRQAEPQLIDAAGLAAPQLVSASALRARLLHGLRREDRSWRARGDRGGPVQRRRTRGDASGGGLDASDIAGRLSILGSGETPMKRLLIAVVLLSASLRAQQPPAAAPARPAPAITPVTDAMLQNPDPNEWLMWRRTLNTWGFSPLDQIKKNNAKDLRMVWTRGLGTGNQEGTPLVHDGVMFIPNRRRHPSPSTPAPAT